MKYKYICVCIYSIYMYTHTHTYMAQPSHVHTYTYNPFGSLYIFPSLNIAYDDLGYKILPSELSLNIQLGGLNYIHNLTINRSLGPVSSGKIETV